MIQFATWTWYEKLLRSYFPKLQWWNGPLTQPVPPSPVPIIKTLLNHGADIYSLSTSGHSILDGLLLNLIQFDGAAHPPEVLSTCLETWLDIVQQLGFNLEDYIHREAALHENKYHDLGLGLHLNIYFNESTSPYIWIAFQGPEERARGLFVDHISKCSRWKEWQHTYSHPKPCPRRITTKFRRIATEVIVLQGCVVSSKDSLRTTNATASQQTIDTKGPIHSYSLLWKPRIWVFASFFGSLNLLQNVVLY